MRAFNLKIDEKYLNLLWRSIHARESELLGKLSQEPEGSDEAALFGNELTYLLLSKK